MSSDDIKFGLSDLEVSDDLNVALDNETYQDQANPAPPAQGNYGFRTLDLQPARYRAGENKGNPIYAQGYPLLELRMVEIVEGLGDDATRKVGLFQTISTAPYERDGKSVSQLGDFARAYGLPNFSSASEALRLLQEAVENRNIFYAQLNWESEFDSEFVKAAVAQFGLPTDDKGNVRKADLSDEQKKLNNLIQYRYARVQGMKNFPPRANGTFSPVLTRGNVTLKTANGDVVVEVAPRTLEARAVIPTFFKDVKFIPKANVDAGTVALGPFKIAVPAAA